MSTHHKVRCKIQISDASSSSSAMRRPEGVMSIWSVVVVARVTGTARPLAVLPGPSTLLTLSLLLATLLPSPSCSFSQLAPPSYTSTPSPGHDYLRHQQQVQNQQNRGTDIGQNITRILNSFFDSGYDKRIRPNYAGPPVEIGVTMRIVSISSINAVQMDFTSDFYFRQSWRDARLSFQQRPGIEALYVGAEVIERIWVPDTFFANEKSALFHTATTPNTFIRIKSNGDVFRSMRLTITSSCPMNLHFFPMDRQSCTIEVESYGYSMADIRYKWGIDNKGSVKMAENLELPQFKVKGHREMQKIEVLTTGNYSRLVCEIEFVRSMGYYLIQIYVPASLIVIISWVSFWLHRNASPARVQLGVTTVLTMTTLMSSTNAAMPKISYIKSIDVFLGTCFVMVFAALLEYATVGYMGKRIAMRKARTQQIIRMFNEHREKCVAAAAASSAAAAAAAAHEAKDLEFELDSPGGGGGGLGRGGSAMSRASQLSHLMQASGMHQGGSGGGERAAFHNELHKRDQSRFRSSSSTMENYNLNYAQQLQAAQQARHNGSGSSGTHRSLERCASIKSRGVPMESGDEEAEIAMAHAAGATQFNDDLSVFVPASREYGGGRGSGVSANYASGSRNSDGYLQGGSGGRGAQGAGGSRNFASRPQIAESQYYLLKSQNTLFGVSPSDIDKYSRVVFPVCFVCFQLTYWTTYLHISSEIAED